MSQVSRTSLKAPKVELITFGKIPFLHKQPLRPTYCTENTFGNLQIISYFLLNFQKSYNISQKLKKFTKVKKIHKVKFFFTKLQNFTRLYRSLSLVKSVVLNFLFFFSNFFELITFVYLFKNPLTQTPAHLNTHLNTL